MYICVTILLKYKVISPTLRFMFLNIIKHKLSFYYSETGPNRPVLTTAFSISPSPFVLNV